uniref:Uncharacterized protein n=1 Tax=Globodera pallida TaxID=36090 RepID=A0A183CFJ8_GLOPA
MSQNAQIRVQQTPRRRTRAAATDRLPLALGPSAMRRVVSKGEDAANQQRHWRAAEPEGRRWRRKRRMNVEEG